MANNSTLSFDANMIELGTGPNSLVRVNGSLMITGDTRIADRTTADDVTNARIKLPARGSSLQISRDAHIDYDPETKILQIDAEHVHFPVANVTGGISNENLFEVIADLRAQVAILQEMMTEVYNAPGMPGYVKSMLHFYEMSPSYQDMESDAE